MKFDALELSIQLIAALRRALEELRQRDADLASQVRRAVSGVALQISEARKRSGKDRPHLFRLAEGSAAEVHTALRVAEAWGYLDAEALIEAYAILDRLGAMLWRLTH